MSFLKRLWGYMKTWFRVSAEKAMDPEIEIEQADAKLAELKAELGLTS